MQEISTELLEKILTSYERYFDVTKDSEYEGLSVAAEAAFHSRSEKYVLVKKAQLWAAEAHEYAFFVTVPHLDTETLEAYRGVILKEGLSRVKPMKDHMYTYVTLIFITDEMDADIVSALKKIRHHENYKLSFYGWSDFRVAVWDGKTQKVFTNSAGKDLKKMFRSVTEKKRRAKR